MNRLGRTVKFMGEFCPVELPKDNCESTMDTNTRRPTRAAEIVHYEVFDELVVYRPGASQAASLNETARAIWHLCDGERTVEDICVELAQMLALCPDDLRSDVCSGVNTLYELGLLYNKPG